MIRAFYRLRDSYYNQTIKKKLFILVSLIMVISFMFTLVGLQHVLGVYDEQMYSKSSQVLSTSSNSIENGLKNIEDVSFAIASDPLIQQYLTTYDAYENNDYEKYRIRTEIIDTLLGYINSESVIHSVHLVSATGEEYKVGARPVNIPETILLNAETQSSEAAGSHIWLHQLGEQFELVSSREIRSYKDLSFDHLGTLIIRVNLDKLVRGLMEGSRQLDGHFVILNGENIMYPNEYNQSLEQLAYSFQTKSGYDIQTIDNRKYFIVHMQSNNSNWTYLNVIPFHQIFEKTTMIKTFLWLVFICMFFIVAFIGMRFARNLTSPLEKLAASMRHVQQGNFKEAKEETLDIPNVHDDEVGKLHQSFLTMIDQIDELIHENYSKQITIKETEFKALQAQINPHFLYNTLESINWLAKSSGQQKISRMVESLGFLLRSSISLKEPLVTISEELQIVSSYITIQSYRFEERLDVHIEIEENLQNAQIPKLTLQPLVENAIQYGLEQMMEPCHIQITSEKGKDHFKLIVEDNGPGMDATYLRKVRKGEVKTKGQGIGLQNIDERIKLSFGEEYGVQIESEQGKGTRVIVSLPYGERG
ncbi:histidine kinase [Bacillus sp. FJAT-50079]|uniref:sensor histidine kinase n=1 Tax=Bacillus sp. FJAT-50079 TaxID=2833577 RepID=UPI001BC944BB|nr:histidine kinase [Bacillus sp. FJAT-50079]MBS4208339.1 sensor histidine kinase [Bacillus sp. FJAT-50079]